jgi:hypothetical protein
MNLYLSKKQEKALHILLNNADELVQKVDISAKEDIEELMQSVMEIREKLTGKKGLAKNGVSFEPVEIPSLSSDDILILHAREDGRAIILESKNKKPGSGGFYRFDLGKERATLFTNYLIQYLEAWGVDYQAEDKSYSEFIHVYSDEVERSIDIHNGKLSYNCYTNKKDDDHWTYLTPHNAKRMVETMLGYLQAKEIA